MDPLFQQVIIAVVGSSIGAAFGAYVTNKVQWAVMKEVVARHDEEIKALRRWRHDLTEKFTVAQSEEILKILRNRQQPL